MIAALVSRFFLQHVASLNYKILILLNGMFIAAITDVNRGDYMKGENMLATQFIILMKPGNCKKETTIKPHSKFLGVVCAILLAVGPSVANAYVIRGGTPGKWGSPVIGTGAKINWSIMGAGLDTDSPAADTVDTNSLLPSGYATAFGNAFSSWAAVADLNFSQVADPNVGWMDATASSVDIRIGFRYSDGLGGNLGFGYYPLNSSGPSAGDIFLDSADTWNLGSGFGYNLKWTLIHEIGHAIGFQHSGIPGSTMYHFYNSAWDEPDADAIAGAQYLYGAPDVMPVPAPAVLPLFLGSLALLGIGLIGRRSNVHSRFRL